jgi:hypothetical protein
MINLVLFSTDYQSTIHTTFSSATVRHYKSDDFYSEYAHYHISDDEFAFYGGLNMLIQSIEDGNYQHIYVVNEWKKSELAIAKLSGLFPVIMGLTKGNVDKINQLAIQHMFYDGINTALQPTIFPKQLMKDSSEFSAIASNISNPAKQIQSSHLKRMPELLIRNTKGLYL